MSMDLNTRLTQRARQLDADQLYQISADEWLLLTADGPCKSPELAPAWWCWLAAPMT